MFLGPNGSKSLQWEAFLGSVNRKINTHYFGITTKFNNCLRVVSEEIRLRQAEFEH